MTISKKLLIAGALIIGMQPIVHAHTNEVNYEVSQMLNFAQTLRQVNHKDAPTVAQWLELQACDTSYNVQDYDIVAIANVINNPQLTIQSKISVLSQAMATQRSAGIKRTINDVASAVLGVAMLGGFATIMGLVIMEDIKNPRARQTIILTNSRTRYWFG